MLFITIIGPGYVVGMAPKIYSDKQLWCRNHSAHFEKAKTAFEEGGGIDEVIEDDHIDPRASDAKEV